MNKKEEHEQIFKYLDFVAQMIPSTFYWIGLDGKVLGVNQNGLDAIGCSNKEFILGKTLCEIYGNNEISHKLQQDIDEIIRTGNSSSQEELIIDITTGRPRYYAATRSPIFDFDNNVIGVMGTSIEITAEKETEKLKLENQVYRTVKEQQEKFKKIVDQVVHDIKSPITTLKMVLPQCNVLPEDLRITINKSITRIQDISSHLLNRVNHEDEYNKSNNNSDHNSNSNPEHNLDHSSSNSLSAIPHGFGHNNHEHNNHEHNNHVFQNTLINSDILDVITEKRYEYSNLEIEFITEISQAGYFAFSNINVREFKRMISNIINNSVDAINMSVKHNNTNNLDISNINSVDAINMSVKHNNTNNLDISDRANLHNANHVKPHNTNHVKQKAVTVSLDVVDGRIQITISDNGCGMPDSVKEKILNRIAITANKEHGHGIGFGQIRDALDLNNGTLSIESKIGVGTNIILTFPMIEFPNWACNKIELNSDDLVIVLDDDPSIHGAWDARFKKDAPNIRLKHFEKGIDTINFINNLSNEERKHIFMLADYELLGQDMHGLDVINKTGIIRSILVTSHHDNEHVRNQAKQASVKILPKLLAAEVFIDINEKSINQNNTNEQFIHEESINKKPTNEKSINTNTIEAKEIKPSTQPQTNNTHKNVDLVIVDDDKVLISALIKYQLQGKNIDFYCSPSEFFKHISSYDKKTKFLIDNNFENGEINGIELCTKLYNLNFYNLYMFSGDYNLKNIAPKYVIDVIEKTEFEKIKDL